MANTTVDQLREGFHYPTIENQLGLPTYSTINTIHTLLKKKAASMPSQLGGEKYGLLGLLLLSDTYK